jgi:hypothetical protein
MFSGLAPAVASGFVWDPPSTLTVLNVAMIDMPIGSDQVMQPVPARVALQESTLEPGQNPPLRLEGQTSSFETEPAPTGGQVFLRGWVAITGVEFALLAVTASMPKDWTGWSDTFIQDGLANLGDAYTKPPVWDDDHWFHNYVGHPYGGSLYYNTVRSQGAGPGQSFLFSALLSTQWEYFFEAVAERPSIQDLFITPITGSILGEVIHSMTVSMKSNGTSLPERLAILVLNPMSVIFGGFK